VIAFVEWAWTLIAGVGLLTSSWLYINAREDVLFLLRNSYNGRRRIVARGHERRESIRAVIQGLGLYVGIYAVTLPNPPDDKVHPVTLCLVAMQLLVVLNSIFDARDRRKLLDYWKNLPDGHAEERDKEIGA
jgi:hypothetical protein